MPEPDVPDLSDRVHAFSDDALGEHDAVGLVAELRSGRVSGAELVDAAISRVARVDGALHGLAHEAFDRARHQARDADRPGFFAGIPTFVKDNCDVDGLPTQQGTTSYIAHPAPADGDWARTFLATGLVNLGKTQLSEFGFNASAEVPHLPAVHNPWQTGHTSGASSAGSAAFVAAGAVPIAHANDGGGSIRIPAACCGLVGLKPTRGRTLSDRMNRQMPVRIVADGVVTRSVRDTAAFLREYELGYRNLRLPPIGDVRGPGRRRLRIAMVVDSPGRHTDRETAAAVRQTAALLESLGHHVDEVPPPVPSFFAGDFLTYWSMLALFLYRTGRRTLDHSFDRHRVDDLTHGLARHAVRNLHRMPLAIARLQGSRLISARFYRDWDVTLMPTVGHLTPRLGHLDPMQPYDVLIERLMEWVSFTPLQNATGEPAISLPLGTSTAGLPIGAMLGAPWGREARLLGVAHELEAAAPFARIQDVGATRST